MQTFDTSSLVRATTHSQEENLLTYYHRLHQARQSADVTGRALLRKEGKRVKEKILFEESLA